MYIRKQKIYTEKKVYPYFEDEHFRFDMLPRVKQMALNRYQAHPWKDLSDSQLLQSAGLIGKDWETGKKGYNLAAVMLLGRDEIIKDICPTYRTDALVRKVNINRYDDRLIVETNLIESYEQLMMFAEKHLPDKFHLEDDARFSLRNAICREILVNSLMHRELTSSYIAKFVIEKDKMTTSNANRAEHGGLINPNDFEPNPKNPIIASFFRNIGLADELGSGVRNLNDYVPKYSGKPPELMEGDIFRTIVPLDDEYSYYNGQDRNKIETQFANNVVDVVDNVADVVDNVADVLALIIKNPNISASEIAQNLTIGTRQVQRIIKELRESSKIVRVGSDRSGFWKIM
jgi:ATP-dependent DNA helicase RecG